MSLFLDKNNNIIKEGDIVFYSENIYGEDNYHYADSIAEVSQIKNDELTTITRVFTPACCRIGGKYKKIEDVFSSSLDIHDYQCFEIIGNVKENPKMMTVEFAEKNYSLINKKMGK